MSRDKKSAWPRERLFAMTVDGELLLNARAIEGIDLVALVRDHPDVFVGLALRPREVRLLSKNVRDACSDAAAILGCKRRRRRST